MSKRGPFDFVDALSSSKVDLSVDGMVGYSAWLTNRHFSKFVDTVMYANQVNMMSNLDDQLQHDYYMRVVRSRKRYSQKKVVDDSREELIRSLMSRYSINRRKAIDAARALRPEEQRRIVVSERSVEEEGRDARGKPRKS